MKQQRKKKPIARKKKAVKRPLRSLKRMAGKVRRALKAPPVLAWFSPETQSAPTFSDDRIPAHYGDNRLVLLVRDPWWLFAYWELDTRLQEETAQRAKHDGAKSTKTVLRVYDITHSALPKFNSYFDIELNFYSDNWYIDVGIPDREWIAEIGYRTDSGRFYALARSNAVKTPSFGLSDVLDEEWMLPEDIYYRIIGRTFGAGVQEGSMDIRKLLEKYLRNVISSERPPAPKTSQIAGAEPVSG